MSKTVVERLKPCPFCGTSPVVEREKYFSNNSTLYISFRIRCRNCGIQLPHCHQIEITMDCRGDIIIQEDEREKAIKERNRRDKND